MELATRAVYRTQVTKLVNRATDYLKSPESKPINNAEKLSEIEEELITYIERIKSASDSLNKSNSEVKSLIKPDDFEKEFDSVAEYEDKSIHVLSRLKGRLDNIRREMQVPLSVIQPSTFQHADATAVRPSTSTHTAKLPTLSLRTFSGDIREWLPFWERFRTAVHDRNDLSGADKFNYLQNHLKGKAAESVSGYMPNEANYDACIALLQEEYGNNERLIEYTTSELMSFPRVSSSHDSIGLRKLYNHIVSNIRSLNSLGVAATKYSVILRTLLVKSFPPELATLFYRNHGQIAETGLRSVKDSDSDDISSVAQGSEPSLYCGDQRLNCVLTFLKREVEALERGGVFISRVQNRDRHVNKTTAGLFVSNETKHSYGSCFFCKSSSHTTEMCSASIPLTKRKDMLKSDGRCFKCTLGGHRSKMCRRKIECCACGGKHATSICDPAHRNVKKIATNNDSSTSSVPTHLTTTNLFSRSTDASTSFVYLQTAVVYLSSGADKSGCHLVRTILDGGSQRTYIKESTVKRLNLKAFDSVDIRIMAFGASEDAPIKPMNRVKIQIKSQFDNRRVWALAVVVPEICANILPVPNAENNGLNLVFADNYVRGVIEDEIGLLIGADVYWKVVKNENHVISDSLRAINTIFGWTLHGETNSGSNAKFSLSASVISLCACGQLQQDLDFERFWSLENIGIVPPTIESRQIPVKESISREGDRYMASLLWRSPDSHIHDYKNGAFLRFQRLTKRLSKDPATLKDYDQAMWELISNGIAETCNDDEKLRNQRTYYMAHHPVYRPEKSTTKTRIVFDASGKEGEHESLNELLSPGPNLMGDLLAILLNFRVGNIALVGDIEKAFLQIKLAPSDKDVHRFFWFKKPLDEQTTPQIATYRMCRLTFGVNCSPCLLSATLLKHLDTESTNFPETCQLLENSFYMDDLALSVDSYERASQCFNETSQILRRAGMNIRKWNSNEERLCEEFKHAGNITDMQKVLGIIWFSKNDRLAVDLEKVANSTPTNITKRSLLQFLAQIYDPLGILGPFILNLKLLFQETWRIKMSWDESLPCYLRTSWEKCVKGLPYLKNITLPRCIQSVRDPTTIQLHIFCDASPSAFGAVAYARVKSANGTIGTTFICSRNRLAPLPSEKKPRIPIPKMELTAATVAARLLKYITKSVKRSFDEVYLWTDSQITLSWILNGGRKAEPYVNNRVKQIRELFPTEIWRFCPGYQNPADLLTRETSARKLQRSTTWLSGPAWLSEDESQWPQIIPNSDMPENSVSLPIEDFTHLTKMDPVFDATRFSKYRKLLRVTAYLLRFVTLLRGKPNETISLNAKEIEAAEIYWIKNIQLNEFNREIDALRNKRSLHNSSTILKLTPKIDENGILRVSSRLSESDFSWGEINPIILPKNSHISSLIVSHIHEQTLHSGVNATLTKLRERFWIIKSRQLIKSTIYRCNVCRFLRCKPIAQPFAPLPKERLLSSKPFENTGIDFAGPLYVRDTTSIISTRKTYILLATCAVTRAVHLELVPDMTTESCILALRRFFARRGIPKLIMSDNAKTFKRASKELQFLNSWTSQEMQDFSSGQGISWNFIVERAPWWGGFWERLVKIVKDLLKATIRREVLTTEQLQTYLSEVEYIVNSRPLTYVGDDPLDLSPLTPANFLIGSFPGTLSAIKEGKDSDIRSKWKERLRLQQHLQKRFKTEYLQQLRSAHHNKQLFSKTIKVGNVVTYNDQFVPRHLWKLARVEQLFIGRDGNVRACELRLSNGVTMRRSVQHVYPLEVEDPLPGGGC